MAQKSTHRGTCQWCGRVQLLPGGLLAKHGYELSHGFMNGVCRGSGHLPYEQSCDLIQRSIDVHRELAAERRAQAAAQRAKPMGSLECSRKVYHPELSSRTRGSVYLWEHGWLAGTDIHTFEFVYANGTKRDKLRQGGRAESLAQQMRFAFASALEAIAADDDAYAEEQTRRLASWAPAELLPRAA